MYTYNDFYNGGGVALGDINDDGLLDVYLIYNQKKNRLYLNRGNFTFKDITEEAGVGGTKPWSSGVSMADVNGDGLLDIYVSNGGLLNSKKRENELFINNGDLTFKEQAKSYGIADQGVSIHAAFFDYDNDGDLDMYLVNNYNSKPISGYNLSKSLRTKTSAMGGDRLYRNNLITNSPEHTSDTVSTPAINSRDSQSFTDVSRMAGIYSSEIGFGLGATVGDVNRDGWMDIYVSNDFFERDYLYLNNGDGSFNEVIKQQMNSISTTSMSGDIADLNHDGYPEIFISDMLPKHEERLKEIADFIGWNKFQKEVKMGYHKKFRRNTLQLNNGNGTFSEIGRYAGVEATAWSWGGLMADFNLNGRRDLFVSNGIYKDVTNRDFFMKISQSKGRSKFIENGRMNFKKLTKETPSHPLSNYMFKNEGKLRFSNRASAWGLREPGFSTGAAYGDLDNDGDLDLIVNNVNMKPFVYRNRAVQQDSSRSWLQVQLAGQPPNTFGVGAKVELTAADQRWYTTQMLQRGFLSSVDPTLHIGLPRGLTTIDSLKVKWPDGSQSLKINLKTRQQVVVKQAAVTKKFASKAAEKSVVGRDQKQPWLKEVTKKRGLNWRHRESSHNDFSKSPLLYQMRSTEGPPLCSGDINNDDRLDFYVGGAANQPGALFLQESHANFRRSRQPALQADRASEDTDCLFFDADEDGSPELLVSSGSNEFPSGSRRYADRLYTYSRDEKLEDIPGALPQPNGGYKPTSVVRAADIDGDSDKDLFTGTRMNSAVYGAPVGGNLLINQGSGTFEDQTADKAPGLLPQALHSAGITSAEWGDVNGDDAPDLILAGEWMPLEIFINHGGHLKRKDPKESGFAHSSGWWQQLRLADLDGDGARDIIAGNQGLNSRFWPSPDQPIQMWVSDFDNNGSIEQIIGKFTSGKGPYPIALRQNIIQQLPKLKQQYPTFADYSGQTIRDIFGPERLSAAIHYQVQQLASIVAWNTGNGSFHVSELPLPAQLAPTYAIRAEDLTGNGRPELLIGGNLSAVKPQVGPYNASYGAVFQQDSTGHYRGVSSGKSGFFSRGEIRSILPIRTQTSKLIIVARNNKKLKIFKIKEEMSPN